MRKFADLHLCPFIQNIEQTKRVINRSSELGYSFVGVSLPSNIQRQKVGQIQNICDDAGIELITRVDLLAKTPSKLLKDLRHLRRKFDLVSVICASKSVSRKAAKDHRVDLLSFLIDPKKRFFDQAEGELASGASASLEIEVAPLLLLKGFTRIRLLSCLRKEVEIAKKLNINIVASSGATNEYLLRTPHDYAAFATLFGLNPPLNLEAFSENPCVIIQKNKEKLSSNYIAPGVKIVGREKY
jgi:ribonuclease P/MRP protein subunit RPP1